MKLQLVIGNKNYSSWSMRPWVLLRQAQIPFEEVQLKFDESDGGLRVAGIEKFSAAGKVPVLMIDGEPVWDSLAICETVAEMFPEKHLWPEAPEARRVARSACAEMHSGFQKLRGKMPMNIRSRYPGKGMNEGVAKDIARIASLWAGAKGPFLFGEFCAADAFYAPVATRLVTYGVELKGGARKYQQALLESPGVKAWCADALKETEFVAEDEPYATAPR
jgi:glutathione S-transferase